MKVFLRLPLLTSLFISSLYSSGAFAYLENQKIPVCMDGKTEIKVDNGQILQWKASTANQFKARGYASGKVQGAPWKKGDHLRFFMKIGPGEKDSLEVIYNISFGAFPDVKDGDDVVVCGDYITSTAQAGGYEPSPVGAIVHWIHYNPANRSGSMDHEHGFIGFGTTLVGFDDAPPAAWDGTIVPGTDPDARRSEERSESNPSGRENPRNRQNPQPDSRAEVESSGRSRPSRGNSRGNPPSTHDRSGSPGRSRRDSNEPSNVNLPEICRHVHGRCQ